MQQQGSPWQWLPEDKKTEPMKTIGVKGLMYKAEYIKEANFWGPKSVTQDNNLPSSRFMQYAH